VFKPIFSTAFVLIWGVIFTIVIALTWWGTGQYPGNLYRAAIGILAALAAHALETDLARRSARRKRLPSTHRKTAAGRPRQGRVHDLQTPTSTTNPGKDTTHA
jgi:hypothetical protein